MSRLESWEEEPERLCALESTAPAVRAVLEAAERAAPPPTASARHEAVFRRALATVDGERAPRTALRPLAAFAAACLIGGVATIALHRTFAARPEVVAEGAATWRLEGRTLHIASGRVVVQPRSPMLVSAGGVEVFVQNGRVAMDVDERRVEMHVEAGDIFVRQPGQPQKQLVAPSDHTIPLQSVEAVPLALAPAVGVSAACRSGDEACLADLASGTGLKAETAQYELALVAHDRGQSRLALERFREHQRRFREGVLAPEACIGIMLDLEAVGDRLGAAEEASRFLARFPDEPRADRVRARFQKRD